MSKTLKLKSGKAFPVDTIRKIAPITDAEREAMAGRYGKPLADFAGKLISIEFADKTKVTGDISLDEVRGQGIGIVNIGGDRYVPAANIKAAEPFTREDADKIKAAGKMTLTQTFRSRVETTAGNLLSQATPAQVLDRRAKAIEATAQGTKAPKTPANG
jgi:hypothetical protein